MSNEDSIQIGQLQLHGAKLTYENEDGEREVAATFECDDYPDCSECGHLDETVDPDTDVQYDSNTIK